MFRRQRPPRPLRVHPSSREGEFLECLGRSAYNFEPCIGGPIKHSSRNMRHLWWSVAVGVFAAGSIAAESTQLIDDRTTAEVMKRFYEGMLARGERPAAALRAAQVATWKTKGWDAPYYWAAFTLQGEWW